MSQSYENLLLFGTKRFEWDGELTETTVLRVSAGSDIGRSNAEDVPFQRAIALTNGAILEHLESDPDGR